MELALQLSAGVPAADLTVVGSSLGGFYATWLAEHLGCRAVLLNPAVTAPRELSSYVGVSTVYQTNAPFEFKHGYIDELRALTVQRISEPQRYLLIAATGDEVLDWREMVAFYDGAQQIVIDGSDHGISDFADHADRVLAFCDARTGTADAAAPAARTQRAAPREPQAPLQPALQPTAQSPEQANSSPHTNAAPKD